MTCHPICDTRGYFARCYCADQFAKAGINFEIAQRNRSFNHEMGTIRGMHWQSAPYEEDKLVSCTSGEIFDVAVDLRPDSNTYLHWFGIVLSADKQNMLFIPKGFAHGYQTLCNNVCVEYSVSEYYQPDAAVGIRYDDPLIGIKWPLQVSNISDKDRSWSLLNA